MSDDQKYSGINAYFATIEEPFTCPYGTCDETNIIDCDCDGHVEDY